MNSEREFFNIHDQSKLKQLNFKKILEIGVNYCKKHDIQYHTLVEEFPGTKYGINTDKPPLLLVRQIRLHEPKTANNLGIINFINAILIHIVDDCKLTKTNISNIEEIYREINDSD